MGKRAVLLLAVLSAVACDEMNRPMAVPQSAPRRGCFSDVECPSSMKCMKGPNDVQGLCEARTSGDDAGPELPSPDAGAPPPAPSHAPAPGDVQL